MKILDHARAVIAPGLLALLVGCVATPTGDPPAKIVAVAETRVATDPQVDADDPELWADARDPRRAVLFATDKSDGLYVHDLAGNVLQFFADGPLNNVDIRTNYIVQGRSMVLVAASDRAKFGIRTYLFDPDTLQLERFGFVPVQIGEPYGFCLGRRGSDVFAIINNKEGLIQQIKLLAGAEGPSGSVARELKVNTQPEGCVVDDDAQELYVGEEDVAIWRFDFDPQGSKDASLIARADNRALVADIEGLAIIRDGANKYLIASSQGDNAYAVFRVEGQSRTYVGRFAVDDGERIDRVTGTDGLTAWSGPIGDYPEGLLAMHDEEDAPHPGQQNYKIVDWRDVRRALNLPASAP